MKNSNETQSYFSEIDNELKIRLEKTLKNVKKNKIN